MTEDLDIQFYQLVLSLQAGAMQQMGKIAHPFTGKIERDMALAKQSIDMLEMIERKTTGNLNPDEKKLFDHILFELRLNYVDELKRDEASGGSQAAGASSQEAGPMGDAPDDPKKTE